MENEMRGGKIIEEEINYRNGAGVKITIRKVYERSTPAQDRLEGDIGGNEFLDTRENIEQYISENGFIKIPPGGELLEMEVGGSAGESSNQEADLDNAINARLDVILTTVENDFPVISNMLSSITSRERVFKRIKELLLNEGITSIDGALALIEGSVERNESSDDWQQVLNDFQLPSGEYVDLFMSRLLRQFKEIKAFFPPEQTGKEEEGESVRIIDFDNHHELTYMEPLQLQALLISIQTKRFAISLDLPGKESELLYETDDEEDALNRLKQFEKQYKEDAAAKISFLDREMLKTI